MFTEPMISSKHLILCCSLLLLPPSSTSIRVFSGESALPIRWPENWSFSISPSNETPGLISFRIAWLVSLLSKGLSRFFSYTTIQKHQFFPTQPSLWSNYHIHTRLLEKTIALTWRTVVGKVIFLLFIMLPRFVIAFLPRSKWKPSSVIVSAAPREEGVWETLEALLAWCSVWMFDLALFHSCCDT